MDVNPTLARREDRSSYSGSRIGKVHILWGKLSSPPMSRAG